MSDFLDHMAAVSRARVADLRACEPLSQLRARANDTDLPPPLQRKGRFDLIAEFKRRSPSAGYFNTRDLTAQVTAYARGGAAAVSVLTEPTQFGGELSHLGIAAETLSPLGIPAIRKDFVVDPYQVCETRAAGGSGVLLIVRMLTSVQLAELVDCAREMSLFVLLEVFDEEDLERAKSVFDRAPSAGNGSQPLVGVNCRDLRSLAVRRERFLELGPGLPATVTRVAESGIESPLDCTQVARAGYDIALVGGFLMQCPDPVPVIGRMLAAGRSA